MNENFVGGRRVNMVSSSSVRSWSQGFRVETQPHAFK